MGNQDKLDSPLAGATIRKHDHLRAGRAIDNLDDVSRVGGHVFPVAERAGHAAVPNFKTFVVHRRSYTDSLPPKKNEALAAGEGCTRAWPVECLLGRTGTGHRYSISSSIRKASARLYFPGGRPFRIDAASFASIFHEKQSARLGDPTHVRGGALTDGAAGMQSPSTTLRDLLSWLVLSGQRTALRKARHNQSQPLRW